VANLLIFNKPYGVLSQFLDHDGHPGLKRYITCENVYPMGRLDRDSEGLLLLSDDGQLQARVADPKFKMPKTYLVQVDGDITSDALVELAVGVMLKDGMTKPAKVKKISPPPLWSRNPPIRERQTKPTSWIELQITEGRNRQVRRMSAAVGFPTLRLVRSAIGPWSLGTLQPGEYQKENVPLPQTKHRGRTKGRGAHATQIETKKQDHHQVRSKGKS
jgi:23S rRNA pseudouridine2457 synthase